MWTRFAITLSVLSVFSSCIMAQKTEEQFHTMLEGLYENSVPQVQPADLKAGSYILLDSREEAEYQTSHIAGAIWIGYDHFDPTSVEHLDKDQAIVVYCTVGYRSERIGEQLKELGFTEVYNLYGGIFEWKNTGNEVVNETETPTEQVHCYNLLWSRWLLNGEKVY